jgi:Polyprenyl synthetase
MLDVVMSLQRTKDLIRALYPVASWPQMVELVDRIRPSRSPGIWEYPIAACAAVGGSTDTGFLGSAAVLCSLISIHLVDDILDLEPLGEHIRLGPGPAANLAIAFQAASCQVLDDPSLSPQTRASLQTIVSRIALDTAYGQSRDQRCFANEEEYWQVVGAKTPPLFSGAFQIGAILGGAPPAAIEQIGQLGRFLGLFVQVSDDLLDALQTPAAADWNRPPNNLAILYALSANHAERDVFRDLAARTREPEAILAAQEILIRCGALSYCAFMMRTFMDSAMATLSSNDILDPRPLLSLLETHSAPLRRLFSAAEAPNFPDYNEE